MAPPRVRSTQRALQTGPVGLAQIRCQTLARITSNETVYGTPQTPSSQVIRLRLGWARTRPLAAKPPHLYNVHSSQSMDAGASWLLSSSDNQSTNRTPSLSSVYISLELMMQCASPGAMKLEKFGVVS